MLHARAVLAIALVVAAPVGARARGGAVATEHQLGAAAGAEMLRAGGTAVDAAVAAAAAICVVHAASCGIGGGGFALVRRADGHVLALDYRERAPAAMPSAPAEKALRTGGLAVGVPGEARGLATLQTRLGILPLADVLAPAIRLAREGFALRESPHLRREIEHAHALVAADPGLGALFLGPDGGPPADDFRIVQPDLAATLDALATRGPSSVYHGATAARIVETVRAHGGVMTEADLAAYRPVWREPLRARFHGRTVFTFPPPGSGGVVLEALGILAHDDLAALAGTPASALHLLAGVLAQSFADRARWYGDPAFTTVRVPALLAPPRLRALRARLTATAVREPDTDLRPDSGTANVAAVDVDGNVAVITTTINTSFGAGIVVPGTGIILNDEMDDFAAAPDVPNAYGLTGGRANAPEPGKRPQSSMSPTIVVAGGRPVLAVGGSGGPLIISGVVQTLLNVVAGDLDARAAVDAPRIHDQSVPPVLLVEDGVPPVIRTALERVGHRVTVARALGAVSAVGVAADGHFVARGDRRKDGGEEVVP